MREIGRFNSYMKPLKKNYFVTKMEMEDEENR